MLAASRPDACMLRYWDIFESGLVKCQQASAKGQQETRIRRLTQSDAMRELNRHVSRRGLHNIFVNTCAMLRRGTSAGQLTVAAATRLTGAASTFDFFGLTASSSVFLASISDLHAAQCPIVGLSKPGRPRFQRNKQTGKLNARGYQANTKPKCDQPPGSLFA